MLLPKFDAKPDQKANSKVQVFFKSSDVKLVNQVTIASLCICAILLVHLFVLVGVIYQFWTFIIMH